MSKIINIVIVSFNSSAALTNSINSVKRNITREVVDFRIIDNNSTKDQIGVLLKSHQNVNVEFLDTNLGFAKANNLAAAECDSEYICFLNPDTLVNQDFFSPIIRFIESNPIAGACAPRLVYSDGSYQNSAGNNMGLWYEFLEATMLIALVRRIQRVRIESRADSGKPLRVGWVSAACMIIKRSVFEQVGGFSEEYFLNYEDIDLCRKLENSGYHNFLFTDLECVHLDHKSFDSNYELLVYSRYESRLAYAKLHYTPFISLIVRFIHIFGLIARFIPSLFIFSENERSARIKGYMKSLKLYFMLKNRN